MAEIVWERMPGRRWLVTIWRPGEQEAERERAARLWATLRPADGVWYAPSSMPGAMSWPTGYGTVCPCCGNPYGIHRAGYSLPGAIFGTGLF